MDAADIHDRYPTRYRGRRDGDDVETAGAPLGDTTGSTTALEALQLDPMKPSDSAPVLACAFGLLAVVLCVLWWIDEPANAESVVTLFRDYGIMVVVALLCLVVALVTLPRIRLQAATSMVIAGMSVWYALRILSRHFTAVYPLHRASSRRADTVAEA